MQWMFSRIDTDFRSEQKIEKKGDPTYQYVSMTYRVCVVKQVLVFMVMCLL